MRLKINEMRKNNEEIRNKIKLD